MTLMGYTSRNIPSPEVYAATIERRVKAKHSGDKTTANALKLVLNTTYGAMLNKYNALYDPLMGRSVCISGQLFLLELANHLVSDCSTLTVIQLNTDGIMVSFDEDEYQKVLSITGEWQERTGFELEEDSVKLMVQKDVNGYVEVPFEGEPKIKGGVLVRGIALAGAFNINNNACVVAKAVKDYLAYGIPVEDTIMSCDRLLDFQLVAKAGSKYGDALHEVDGQMEVVQKVNRVYATEDHRCGTLYKIHLGTGNPVKIAGLPAKCVVDNDNHLTIDVVDRDWYIRLAKRYVRDFLGEKPPKRNTRRVNSVKKKLLALFDEPTPLVHYEEPFEPYAPVIYLDNVVLKQTGAACPEQYEVFTADGVATVQIGYLGLRHGYFKAVYPDHNGEVVYDANPVGEGAFASEEEREFHLRNAVNALVQHYNKVIQQ